ncbi:glycoside hydrolase family 13 protein [Turicibacter sanguinis]|uniref:glycoside hydrolase family 13 protein n=1 Tax=Turicibacter sanguinis TaxID=154288 RepID=UPI0018ABAEF6|nr:alpha-glucosidase [Turicibacter sanguinis]MDB8551462.1 alpha-glucosidase [Turicibacter sanguinis]
MTFVTKLDRKWWKEAVGYQIYPKSFCDSNGDGIGDINGITSKLDYLNELGVNLLWLCPIYKSPMDDNGYDVSDYYDIAKEFGTMEDFKTLLSEAKKREIKIVMDLVLNHTSDEHPWFIEARQSTDNPYRDYYIWQKGKINEAGEEIEPTNWASFFTPSCWEKDEQTGEYFMHIFSKKMPDLNWANENMRKKLFEMVKWWLDLGIDGFRVDAVAHIDRDFTFTDSTLKGNGKYVEDWSKFSNLPKVHDYLKELNREVLSKYDIFTVGEVGGGADVLEALKYAGEDSNELNMVFTFDHCWLNSGFDSLDEKWNGNTDLVELKKVFKKWQTGLYSKAWNPLYWLNHDHPRVMSQYGDPTHYHKESGKMLATSLLMMWGTPFLYNGEEIGMTNANYTNFEDYRDVSTIEKINRLLQDGYPEDLIRRYIGVTSRDNARTPMQWNSSENAGFTSGEPWIKVNSNYATINVEAQLNDEDSIFNHYKKLIHLRRYSEYKDVIVYGDYELLSENHPNVYAYTRTLDHQKLLIVSNFFAKPAIACLKQLRAKQIILSNYEDSSLSLDCLMLRPFESIVFELE